MQSRAAKIKHTFHTYTDVTSFYNATVLVQELIQYRYLSSCCCCSSSWGDPLQKTKRSRHLKSDLDKIWQHCSSSTPYSVKSEYLWFSLYNFSKCWTILTTLISLCSLQIFLTAKRFLLTELQDLGHDTRPKSGTSMSNEIAPWRTG